MRDFILLMYSDATDRQIADNDERWAEYLTTLRDSGKFAGGSAIGHGIRVRKGITDQTAANEIEGFIRIRAEDIASARSLVIGNPVFEGGGTVEIRELPRDS